MRHVNYQRVIVGPLTGRRDAAQLEQTPHSSDRGRTMPLALVEPLGLGIVGPHATPTTQADTLDARRFALVMELLPLPTRS